MATTARGDASRRAYDRIRHDIVAGTLAPGTMLSENELATELGMSRTPVRTALSRLQSEGWVTIYPQRGALVRELTADEVREQPVISPPSTSAHNTHQTTRHGTVSRSPAR